MEPHSNYLTITYAEKEGPFLKVWGQTDKNTFNYVQQVLNTCATRFDNGFGIPHPETLQVGILCCAKQSKHKEGGYFRARLTSLDYLHNRYVEVHFVDLGLRDVVPVSSVRSLDGFESAFIAVPPQAHAFILAEAVCPQGEWDAVLLEEVAREVRGVTATFTIVAQIVKHYLVRLVFANGSDLAALLISRAVMRQTSLTTQEAVLLSRMPRSTPEAAQGSVNPQNTIASYKAHILEPGVQYEVYVSYISDGPCNFSVQLKRSEDVLGKLMKDINSMSLSLLDEMPLPGTVCLARCTEDGHICRAVVTNEVDGNFKVFYVDFGNFEVVPLESLYEVPFKFVILKAMAIRYALAGIDKSTVTLEMQCAFKEFVDNRLLLMKVLPMTTRASLPKCELWDPQTGVSAHDVIIRAAVAAFPEPTALTRGFSQPVKASFVFSCNRFYVQLTSKQEELFNLMTEIQTSCAVKEPLKITDLKPGLPCCALFQSDEQWYRSRVVDIESAARIKVHYVDYGNDEYVGINLLRPIDGAQLTALRPQAIECSLNGYQNLPVEAERDIILEQLIMEQEFGMKVVEMQGKKALVELFDANNYNVASMLLVKVAETRSQVSPILVQAGNKIEQRKTVQTPKSSGSYENRKPALFKSQTTGVAKEKNSIASSDSKVFWRQYVNKKGTGRQAEGTEENNQTWRQGNKGFKNKRDSDLNDSSETENTNRGFQRNNDRNKNENDDSWRDNRGGYNKNRDRPNNRDQNNDWSTTDDNNDRWPAKNNHHNNNASSNHVENDTWGDNNAKKSTYAPRDNNKRDDRGGGRERKNFAPRSPRDGGGGGEGGEAGKDEWGSSNNNREKNFNRGSDRGGGGERDGGGGGWGGGDRNNRDRKNFNNPREDGDNKNEWGGGGGRREFKGKGNFDNKKSSDSWGDSDKKSFGHGSGDAWGGDNKRAAGGGGERNERKNFRREGSEISSSGSETSFKRGQPRQRDGHAPHPRKTFDKPSPSGGGDTWDAPKATPPQKEEVPDPAPPTAQFATVTDIGGTEGVVTISWFYNPSHFFCLTRSAQDALNAVMNDIQQAYKNRVACAAAPDVGSPVIALFPEDKVLYRARMVEVVDRELFKVHFVDFGNISLVKEVWPIENRFMSLPAQAVCCKLHGVEPSPRDAWADAGTYSKYFDRPQFNCQFVGIEDDRVAVKLHNDNVDISDGLISDGLGKAPVTLPPIEPALLPGQQFRGMLISVNDLSDFTVSLQSGEVLNCSLHNLSAATESWPDTLKAKLDTILIVYVDDFNEESNKLTVTLYDADGAILKLIDKLDEDTYETVELLCSYLIKRSSLTGEVTHVNGTTAWIQPQDCCETVQYLLNALYDSYEQSTLEAPLTPVEGFVYAVKGSDDNWYRGRVVKFDDKQAVITYVDYGNAESVDLGNLRELLGAYLEIVTLALSVIVNEANAEMIGSVITLNLKFGGDTGLMGSVVSLEGGGDSEVVAEVPPQEIVESAVQEEPVVAAVPSEPEDVAVAAASVPGTVVVLSHTDSPTDFYLQLYDSASALEQLQATLQERVQEMPDLDNPTIGVLCAAPYSLDQQWYRAQVLDLDADITTVRFVDYGNTDVLDNATTRVKTLPSDLLTLEVYATRSRLRIKPADEEWSSNAMAKFEELCAADILSAQFLGQDEKSNSVSLYSNGTNVADVLVAENLALPDPDTIGGEEANARQNCFVSHLNSPSEFWIQLENCCDELEWIAEQLSAAEGFAELEDLSPGTLCAALFPDDQMWYRARILSNTVAGIEVLFVDYGNSCTSCSLRALPEDLVMMAPLAQKCSLQRPEGLTTWGPEMVAKFTELAADGQTTFAVNKLSTGETSIVELTTEGSDIVRLLLPTNMTEVRVKSVDEGLVDLVLVGKDGEELAQHYKLEALPDLVWNGESHKKFCEISNDGVTLLNAEFVLDDTVRLYLGLNDIRLDLTGTKITTSTPLKARPDLKDLDDGDKKSDTVLIAELSKSVSEAVVPEVNNDKIITSCAESNSHEVVQEVLDDLIKASSAEVGSQGVVKEVIEDLMNKISLSGTTECSSSSVEESIDLKADNEPLEKDILVNNDSVAEVAEVAEVPSMEVTQDINTSENYDEKLSTTESLASTISSIQSDTSSEKCDSEKPVSSPDSASLCEEKSTTNLLEEESESKAL